MKLAVIGSRTFQDYEWLEQCLLKTFVVSDMVAIVSGGARGADALAVRFARKFGLPLEIVSADWEAHGRKAGPLRNTEIVRRSDVLAAFWDGHSRGTRDSISKARMAGKRIVIFPCDPRRSVVSDGRAGRSEMPTALPLPGMARKELGQISLFPEEADE